MSAGFKDIDVEAVNPTINLGGGGSLEETVQFLLGTGPLALCSMVLNPGTSTCIDAVTGALAEYYEPGQGVAMGTGGRLVSAAPRR